jgi:SAM-dependent methyltransferase
MIGRIYRKLNQVVFGKILKRKFCPVCNTYQASFLPLSQSYQQEMRDSGFPYTLDDYETMNGKEYACPTCSCSDRDRLYAIYFQKSIDKNRKYSLLDIAPAKQLREYLKKFENITYRSADLFMDDVDDKVDVCNMKEYSNNLFDIFICSHVFEHVVDDSAAMKELYRVLKPGGWGIAMVPIIKGLKEIDEDPSITDEKIRLKRFGQIDHIRAYNRDGFKSRLQSSGFKISEVTVKDFSEELFSKCGIAFNSILYIANK